MTVKEIIKNVCIYLGKEELLNSSFFETNGQELTKQQTKDINKMVECLNYVTEELATEYLPIIKTKQIKLTSGVINLNEIDEDLMEIISVKTINGRTLRYLISNDKMICLATNVEISYKVYPKTLDVNSMAENFGGKISARVIAYGVASEYCFLEMLYDDATLWESRYKNALLVASRKKCELKIKKRGWF